MKLRPRPPKYIHLNPLKARLVRRLDSGAWTSHRAYLGKDSALSCLTTETMIGHFGDTARLHAFVRSVHTKAVCYPDDFNPETGLFSRKAIAKRIQRYNQKPELAEAQKQSRFQKSDEVLEQVLRISDIDLEEIMTASKGPGANPARRFAIWALSHKAGLSHKAVAETLSASQNQVAKLVSRMRKNEINPPVKGWIERFLAQDK